MLLYRATVMNLCDDEDYMKSTIYLDYTQFKVIKETFHFYIIKVNGKNKRIGINSKNQFATPTKEKALMDAWHRNRRYRSILNSKLEYAKRINNFIKEQINKNQ
jgi:hypothetical protein